jgi:iron complex transport system substrate-binding protein
VSDDLGHTVTLRRIPQRIVSLAPIIMEILFALGADSSLIAVTEYCDYPPAALNKPRVGGMLNPNLERIVDLRPELVLMSGSGNIESDYHKLTSSGVTVFVTYPKTVENVFTSIASIGALTGRASAADSIIQSLRRQQEELLSLARGRPRQSVLMLLSLHPIVAIGPGTFVHELLTMANADNAAREAPMAYPVLSREEIVRSQPDVLLATNDIVRSTEDILEAYPEWKRLNAVRGRRVALVDASLVSRPGPRVIEGLRTIVEAIHPPR